MKKFLKFHMWYCIVLWSLYLINFILADVFYGTRFQNFKESLYVFGARYNFFAFLVSLIPIHLIFGIISVIESKKQNRRGYKRFSIISIIVACTAPFFLLMSLGAYA